MDKNKGKNFSKIIQEAISRDNLTTKRVCMFSRRVRKYIIAYKLMIHKKTLADLDIELFNYISADIIYNIVKYFNTHRFMLDFYDLLLSVLVKETK